MDLAALSDQREAARHRRTGIGGATLPEGLRKELRASWALTHVNPRDTATCLEAPGSDMRTDNRATSGGAACPAANGRRVYPLQSQGR